MNVVLIGSGNVATVLGRLITAAGHTVKAVVSRNINHSELLAGEFEAPAFSDIHAAPQDANMYIIAVSDTAIPIITAGIHFNDKLIVHTSGSVSKKVLQNASNHYGVIYPLQSLRKEATHIPEIPLLVDGNTEKTEEDIYIFAQTISRNVKKTNDEERLKLHLSAVIVSNFTNHLYSLTRDYCEKEGADFHVLIPLIKEVADRLFYYDPKNMQTGPAIRNDNVTIQTHIKLLSSYPLLHKIYGELTESIQQFYFK